MAVAWLVAERTISRLRKKLEQARVEAFEWECQYMEARESIPYAPPYGEGR